MGSEKFTQDICKVLSSKKAEDILIVDVSEKTVLCDYFVICSGRNTTQVKALCENVEEKFSKEGIEPRRTEVPPFLPPRKAVGRGQQRRPLHRLIIFGS